MTIYNTTLLQFKIDQLTWSIVNEILQKPLHMSVSYLNECNLEKTL